MLLEVSEALVARVAERKAQLVAQARACARRDKPNGLWPRGEEDKDDAGTASCHSNISKKVV